MPRRSFVGAGWAKFSEKNQQEIALTLGRLVALLEARDEAETTPSGLRSSNIDRLHYT